MKRKRFVIAFALVALVMTGCEKFGDFNGKDIEGTYKGTLTQESSLKIVLDEGHGITDAIAEVSDMGDGMVEVHCYGSELDTTILFNYYDHNDSVMVCLTGEEFEGMYGHSLGQGHMEGGLMGDMGSGDTNWMHHMSGEHESDDEHFGGFDMDNHSFEYTFQTDNDSFHFKGIKE